MYKVGRFGKNTLDLACLGRNQRKTMSTMEQTAGMSRGKKMFIASGGLLTAAALGVCYALDKAVFAADLPLHPPKYPWKNYGLITSFDAESLRRGWQVYKQVCSACHSLRFVRYREFVDVFMTEDEAKAEAAEAQILDGPDAKGEMFMRPGKLSDAVPSPYPNEEAARAANNGAYPPDLSYIVPARHGDKDYVMALLTGYCDPPAGVTLNEGQYFNPYFTGGAISMAQALYNDSIEYADGTPASASQLAKDVSDFLEWTSMPEHDYKKRLWIKMNMLVLIVLGSAWYWKRHQWINVKTRKVMLRK